MPPARRLGDKGQSATYMSPDLSAKSGYRRAPSMLTGPEVMLDFKFLTRRDESFREPGVSVRTCPGSNILEHNRQVDPQDRAWPRRNRTGA